MDVINFIMVVFVNGRISNIFSDKFVFSFF